jgi:hypothetical protein
MGMACYFYTTNTFLCGLVCLCVCVCVCMCVCVRKLQEVKSYSIVLFIFMDQCIVDDSVEIPTRCSFVIEFIIPKFIEGSTCFEWHTAHHQEP